MTDTIDARLTEIDINELFEQTSDILFSHITDDDITKCLQQGIFLTTNAIYNASNDNYSYKNDNTFDVLKIATIANEINNGTYNYNYPIVIWDDSEEDDTHIWDTDGNGLYHIRAFHYCKKNIYLSVNRSG